MKILLTLMAIFSPTTTIIANTTCYENKQDNNANYQIGFQSSTENNKIDSATKENNKLRYRVYIDRSAD